MDEIRVIELDRKWPLGIRFGEYKGVTRLDVRTYNPDGMQPTKKGISVPIDDAVYLISEMLDAYCKYTEQSLTINSNHGQLED